MHDVASLLHFRSIQYGSAIYQKTLRVLSKKIVPEIRNVRFNHRFCKANLSIVLARTGKWPQSCTVQCCGNPILDNVTRLVSFSPYAIVFPVQRFFDDSIRFNGKRYATRVTASKRVFAARSIDHNCIFVSDLRRRLYCTC